MIPSRALERNAAKGGGIADAVSFRELSDGGNARKAASLRPTSEHTRSVLGHLKRAPRILLGRTIGAATVAVHNHNPALEPGKSLVTASAVATARAWSVSCSVVETDPMYRHCGCRLVMARTKVTSRHAKLGLGEKVTGLVKTSFARPKHLA